MNENKCPVCAQALEWNDHYHCEPCHKDFSKIGYCPECEAELEKLQACGAANYFCNHCNELKSKSRIRFQFKEKTTD
ncbi:zinc ribbon domain-containing protein [Vibrio sp. IRLE0018]|uniref:zinc ribbon domain-containing protein n=1 Tax=Vibrio floridensis TaxID=2908007 RepID=UPI001F47F1C4|nr:zinc ribbon domain-containing protein [Vibrio floridensis]MCF8779464.1 zinc ribbon domain-containing protein [Vibrio floridensis]